MTGWLFLIIWTLFTLVIILSMFLLVKKIIKSNKYAILIQDETINILDKSVSLYKEQLLTCKEIMGKQHSAIQDCDKFLMAFIASTQKEMQEKDRTIELLRKRI